MPLTDYQLLAYLGRARFIVRMTLPEPERVRWVRVAPPCEDGEIRGATPDALPRS